MESAPLPPPISVPDLPADVRDNILFRLPIRDVVRTSVISPEWQHVWKYTPNLHFEEDDDFSFSADVIDTVLRQHSAPIRSFSLGSNNIAFSDTNRWLVALADHPISSFKLHLDDEGPEDEAEDWIPPPLHTSLFSFTSLKSLSLNRCIIPSPPSSFRGGFPKLDKLHLVNVCFSDEKCLPGLIAESPNLTYLHLEEVFPSPPNLVIPQPNLRYLRIATEDYNSVTIAAAQVLKYLGVDLYANSEELELAGSLECHGMHRLGFITFRMLTKRGVPRILPGYYRNLTILDVSFQFAIKRHMLILFAFMRSAPNLKEIKILGNQTNFPFNEGDDALIIADKDFWTQQIPEKLDSLRVVVIYLFCIVWDEMNFLRFVLEKAHLLKKLHIISCNEASSLNESLLDMLEGYKGGSSETEIIHENKF